MVGLRIAALVLGIAIGVAATATSGMGIFGPVAADSPEPVGPHRHYTITASGEKVYVGPNFCTNTVSDEGFAAFHWNVHKALLPTLNDVVVLGEGC